MTSWVETTTGDSSQEEPSKTMATKGRELMEEVMDDTHPSEDRTDTEEEEATRSRTEAALQVMRIAGRTPILVGRAQPTANTATTTMKAITMREIPTSTGTSGA